MEKKLLCHSTKKIKFLVHIVSMKSRIKMFTDLNEKENYIKTFFALLGLKKKKKTTTQL